ncbi:MAG: caspase family protein [Saprospiraceae bacterium]|nr:caspase family protein [Saprospiraceae bacterium]
MVVGISNYQDEGITDLRFANRDASEFAAYLKTKSGGGLKEEQIKLLTDAQATTAQIYSALDWLIESCGPDDQALIYFSGHGDVETKTIRQQGFLLAYDTPKTNYMIGAVRLSDLNGYLESIVQERKARVIVITDACRSGNLAGGREGASATAAALSSQFQNQVKIMSCQPNELSVEGEQWGGGRGVFSYHLIDGLTGLADANKDSTVTLMELERYLGNTVPTETDQQQFPFTVGVKTTKMAQVDVQELLALMAKRDMPAQFAPIAPKGMIEDLLAQADTSVQELYEEFLTAVGDQYFLPSDLREGRKPGRSASQLYDRLAKEEALRPVHSLMKRNFAAALQDESQRAINAYLRADQAELAKRWNNEIDRYKTNPVYLSKAASLLGEGHVLYHQLKAKQYYFEGLIKRLEGGQKGDTVMLNEALALEFKALEMDSGAAYVYNEIGLIYDEIRLVYKGKNDEDRNQYYSSLQLGAYEVAIGLAPKWVVPVYNSTKTYKELGQFQETKDMGLKTIALDSNLVDVYDLLGHLFYITNQYEKSIEMYLKLLRFKPVEISIWQYNIACLNSLLNRPKESIFWLEESIKNGFEYSTIMQDADLENLQKISEFKFLMNKYFPNEKK